MLLRHWWIISLLDVARGNKTNRWGKLASRTYLWAKVSVRDQQNCFFLSENTFSPHINATITPRRADQLSK
jgi:hypothetical protein